jgi:hypothetical protein
MLIIVVPWSVTVQSVSLHFTDSVGGYSAALAAKLSLSRSSAEPHGDGERNGKAEHGMSHTHARAHDRVFLNTLNLSTTADYEFQQTPESYVAPPHNTHANGIVRAV